MYKRILFIVESIVCKRDFERFQFNDFIQSGYDLNILDLTDFNNPKYNDDSELYFLLKDRTFSPKNKEEILNYLNIIDKNEIIISFSRVNNKTYFIYKKLKKNGNKIGFVQLGTTPDVYFFLKKNLLRLFLRKIKNRIIQKSQSIFSNFYVVGSKADILKSENHVLFNKKSHFINYNSFDYDLYLSNEKLNNKKTSTAKYVVFLDEDNLNHPDNNISGFIPVGKNYYLELNRFFSKIENKFSLKVVVAAHPRSDYTKNGNPYKGRKIIKFKTIELVKHSEFVLAHASTSITMAVLYSKPIISLTSTNYKPSYIKSIKNFSSTLSNIIIDVSDENYNLPNYIELNQNSYKSYFSDFVNFKNFNNVSLIDLIENYFISKS